MTGKQFKPGDIVQLKSGGPKMTVEEEDGFHQMIDGPKTYFCTWFAGAKHNKERFPEMTLQEYTEGDE